VYDLLALLEAVCRNGSGWTARCPAHRDRHNSLSVARGDRCWLLTCHAGCELQEIITALGIEVADLFDDKRRGGEGPITNRDRASAQPRPKSNASGSARSSTESTSEGASDTPGLTLAKYAEAKALPVDYLKTWGLSEFTFDCKPALRIPYLAVGSTELAVRFRIALQGDRFRWKSGSKPCLYGLHRLPEAQEAGHVVLVEGESDCHTLWFHGIPALGIPGATNWREERDAKFLDGLDTIYVVIEPDRGGDAVRKWLSRSAIRNRVKQVTLSTKDPSALHLESPQEFGRRWQVACMTALPWTAVEAEASAEERNEAWEKCSRLAGKADILEEFASALSAIGVVGERRAAKLLYLVVTSRLLDRPVSVAVKGPSSGGKSFVVDSTLRFFPPSAFYALTAMSERAMAYSTEPLVHRQLVIYEAAGMASDFATYLIRTLLSEGRLRYETVEKTKDGLVPRVIEREGPTGLIVTTTSHRLHPENETRMVSLTITDTSNQTAAVICALARESNRPEIDVAPWHALQTWLATGPVRVTIPFADQLAKLVPPVAVRLRRDFKTVLTLVRAHALLHQASRRKDEQGQVIATIDDYAQIRDLVADLVAEGVDQTVKLETREVVEAVSQLLLAGKAEIQQSELVTILKLDRSAISRRVAGALNGGFLKNLEDRKGRPHRLVMGDAMPADVEVLPAPADLRREFELRGCAIDPGDKPAPPSGSNEELDQDDASADDYFASESSRGKVP